MEETEELRAARAMRRAMLGDAYVDRATSDADPAATSEAIAFGVSEGLDMATMLEVLNGASGRSAATSDKFPHHVLTGRYASGFTNSLMAKDVDLYLRAVEDGGGSAAIGAVTVSVWERFANAEPGSDFTRIYPFIAGS